VTMMMRYWPNGCSGDDGDGDNDIGSGGRFIACQPAVMELGLVQVVVWRFCANGSTSLMMMASL